MNPETLVQQRAGRELERPPRHPRVVGVRTDEARELSLGLQASVPTQTPRLTPYGHGRWCETWTRRDTPGGWPRSRGLRWTQPDVSGIIS